MGIIDAKVDDSLAVAWVKFKSRKKSIKINEINRGTKRGAPERKKSGAEGLKRY